MDRQSTAASRALMWRRVMLIVCMLITIASLIIGLFVHESDLIGAGIITTLVLFTLFVMGEKRGYVKKLYFLPIGILMIPCVLVDVLEFWQLIDTGDFWWKMDIICTIPVYIATAFAIIGILIGYCGVRLDPVMMGVYIFFTSLAMGGFIGAGYYLYNYNRGIPYEEQMAMNYYMGWEYLAVIVAAAIIALAVNRGMKLRNVKLLRSEHILEDWA